MIVPREIKVAQSLENHQNWLKLISKQMNKGLQTKCWMLLARKVSKMQWIAIKDFMQTKTMLQRIVTRMITTIGMDMVMVMELTMATDITMVMATTIIITLLL